MLTALNSNTLTNLLFEKSEDFIGIYDLNEERFVRVNKVGARMLGFVSEAAMLADPVRSRSLRFQPLSDENRATLITQIRQTNHFEELIQVGRQDGRPLMGRLVIDSFAENEQAYALIRLIDQARLVQAERELEHSVRRYEAIFSSATIGIIVCDKQGAIVSANQLANQLFGYSTDEILALTIEQLVPTRISHYHQKLRQSFNESPQVRAMGHNRDLNAQRKDGSVFPVEVSLSYFRLEDELYAVAYIIDSTFKKEAERQLLTHRDDIERLNADLEQKVVDRTHALMNTLDQLEQSKDELARALAVERELGELKSRFVAMASHEFRTPLTAVLTSATLIEKYTTSDQQDKREKHLMRIRASVNHLNDILEEFLSVGKLEEGKVETHPAEINLAKLVDETITDMRSALKPGQTIQTQIDCTGTIWIDPSMLRKILVNLLSNAIKYSGLDSVVSLWAACSDANLKLVIKDQGVGIAKEDQEHLFERFFRARNVTNIAGTGLGLHIVGRYVDLMGGTITLTSELNKGTTLTLNLPYENYFIDRRQ
ncbi:PAS domain-containing sensor histidine kinase [Spirosoma sp.]|uniref:sensor histidine kinase n=1 Tax=Spirosoma sp. TaxID=1899569 RepID=UPI002602BFB6|nr:PAS domain-containing sensor histidine kinase [Spirosoma sp.]MCX6217214.1 PAS domain-containing sensor histidine kinase [Spirosoma sp.]